MSVNILLVGSTDRQLEEALRGCGMTSRRRCRFRARIARAARSAKQPDVLVIDIRDQSHLPAALPLLKRQHPSTGVVIVASRLDPALLLEAMRSGVNEFVSRAGHRGGARGGHRSRVVAHRPVARAWAKLFAFVGAKGGVGTTTVAVNVATALAQLQQGSTLLIDLHVANGDAAVFLGAEPRSRSSTRWRTRTVSTRRFFAA